MRTVSPDGLRAAETFMQLNGRLIDRLRFAYHFAGGSAGAVVQALRAYQNADGGLGHGLESDLRGPSSQPIPAQHALDILDEVGRFDDPIVARVCDYLSTISQPDGGVPFVMPTARDEQRAPWWEPDDKLVSSLTATGALVAALHKHAVDNAWVAGATEFCWQRIETLDKTTPYEARAIILFLDQVPDRDRAEAALERVRAAVLACVELDPAATGEAHFPLDFATRPDSVARGLFSDDLVDRHLDALVEAQREDGGWDVNWLIWTPIVRPEWRGWMTVHTLLRLRAYRRVSG